jgi:conjugal transfer ATP-binding protein TraC
MLASFGEKILGFLGEKNQGAQLKPHLETLYKKLRDFYKINELFPYESYDDKYQLFFNMDSVGFVLETPPLVGSSEEMQKEVNGLFQHLLPEGSSLQVMLFADPHLGQFLDEWQANRLDPMMYNIAKRRKEYLNTFAFDSPNKPYCLRNFRCLISYSQKDLGKNPVVLQGINQLKNQFKTSLEMLGLPVAVWNAVDFINTLSSIFNLNPDSTQHFVKRWDQLQSLSEQISNIDAHLSVYENVLKLNQEKIEIRTYQVAQSPSIWSLHAMGQLIGDEDRDMAQIPCPFMIHYGIHIPKQGKPKAKVLSKATIVSKQAESPIGEYLPSLKREAEELRFVREQIGKGERIVQTQLTLILFATSESLSTAEQILLNLYRGKEWQLQSNRLFHLPVFLSCMPMMWGEDTIQSLLHHKKLKTTLSTEAANLLPLQGEWKGTKSPGMLLGGRRGQVMSWYPFDNNAGNYNVCVIGRSGSGKSVFMQELMTTTLGLGGKVFVLDVGRSFEKTCYLLQGQFVEFKAKTPLCLNPFSTIPLNDLEAAQDALAMLKSILVLMAAPTKGVDDMEAALLEQAMLEVWKNHQRNSNISYIAAYLNNHRDKKAQDLGTMLFPYTEKGIYGRFFNGISTVNLDNALVVIELEELKERKDLQAVIVQMIIINITNRMFLGDRKTPFTIVFDEAWDLLRGAQSGIFIETLARRLRKYYGSLVVGTQSLNDLFSNPAAQAAFDNSDWMCLLSQKSESIAQLKKLERISLTAIMESQLKSVKTKQGQYAEVMIYGSNGYAIGRLLLDPYSQLLYSTKAEDYAHVKTLMSQGYDVSEALEILLTQKGEPNEKVHD